MTKAQPKLINCPFCGAEQGAELGPLLGDDGSVLAAEHAVVCFKCHATGPHSTDPHLAVQAWNSQAARAAARYSSMADVEAAYAAAEEAETIRSFANDCGNRGLSFARAIRAREAALNHRARENLLRELSEVAAARWATAAGKAH